MLYYYKYKGDNMGYFINKNGELEKAKPIKLTPEQRKKYLKQTSGQKKRMEEAIKRQYLLIAS